MAYDRLVEPVRLREWLKVEGTDDDVLLAGLIDRVSDLIGRYCGRDNLGAVIAYTEPYFPSGTGSANRFVGSFNLVLRHYPIVAVTSVSMNNGAVSALDNTGIQTGQAGYYVDASVPEPRMLRMVNMWRDPVTPILVTYTAGYQPTGIPPGLQQAAIQGASEVYRSKAWVGYRSKSIQGEVVTFETGEAWGLSKRTQAMCNPYRNVVPDSFTGAQ